MEADSQKSVDEVRTVEVAGAALEVSFYAGDAQSPTIVLLARFSRSGRGGNRVPGHGLFAAGVRAFHAPTGILRC